MELGEIADKLPVWVVLVFAAAPGLWAVWKQWLDRENNRGRERSDLVKIAQEAAGEVIDDLRQENARVRDRLAQIEREFGEFRRMHDGMIAEKDAEIALLRGELRQWKALAQSYEQKLSAAGIEHEKPRQPFWGVDAGDSPTELIPGRLP